MSDKALKVGVCLRLDSIHSHLPGRTEDIPNFNALKNKYYESLYKKLCAFNTPFNLNLHCIM